MDTCINQRESHFVVFSVRNMAWLMMICPCETHVMIKENKLMLSDYQILTWTDWVCALQHPATGCRGHPQVQGSSTSLNREVLRGYRVKTVKCQTSWLCDSNVIQTGMRFIPVCHTLKKWHIFSVSISWYTIFYDSHRCEDTNHVNSNYQSWPNNVGYNWILDAN